MNSTLYIVAHKPYTFPKDPAYKVIQVGYMQENFSLIRDNLGIAIPEKNKNFCELTALYWIWKNDLSNDIIGVCHYRRYFNLSNPNRNGKYTIYKNNISSFEELVATKNITKYLNNHDIILPCPVYLGPKSNMLKHYAEFHDINDLNILKETVLALYPEYKHSINKSLKRKWLYSFNMFIMSKELFNSYMTWLFSIIEILEKKIIIKDDTYQARVFGFLAERLLNIYVDFNNFKIKEVPYIVLLDNNRNKYISKRKMFLKKTWNDIKP